jgi:hypothetical protein
MLGPGSRNLDWCGPDPFPTHAYAPASQSPHGDPPERTGKYQEIIKEHPGLDIKALEEHAEQITTDIRGLFHWLCLRLTLCLDTRPSL